MQLIDHEAMPVEWRGRHNDIEHRTLLDHTNGAMEMSLWLVRPPQGAGAPPHIHQHEETITVLSGSIKIQIDRQVVDVEAGQTVFIPVHSGHSFAVTSEQPAELLVAFPVADPQYESIDWKTWFAKDTPNDA